MKDDDAARPISPFAGHAIERSMVELLMYFFLVPGIVYFVVLPKHFIERHCGMLASSLHGDDSYAALDGADEEAGAAAPKRPARAYYIDRLRVALTALVVCHHAVLSFDGSPGSVAAPWGSVVEYTTAQPQTPIFSRSISAMWFLNLNQLYFMGLFFFISGYFTPASFDRKGAFAFLKERVKRLAIPCVVYYFVIGPVLECWLMPHVITRKSKNKHWTIVEGPPWYLCTLVIFSCVYVACPHDIDRAAPAPSVGAFLLVGGLFMGVLEHAMSGATLLWLNPVTCYYSVQYVTWFAAGVYAYRQNWLETIVGYAPSTATFLRCVVVAFAGYLFFAIKALTYFGADNAPTTGSLEVLGAVWAVAVSLALLHGFGQHNEKPSKLAKAACDAAYAVYVIHPIFLALAVWAYAGMLSAGHDVTQRIPASVTRGAPIHNDRTFYVRSSEDATDDGPPRKFGAKSFWGEIFVALFANAMAWPAAYGLKQLPGVRDVL